MKKRNTKKQPAVFLDRDGTLIEDVDYLSRVEDLRVFPFTADALKLLKDNGFLLIVVTNQSGIGRGVFNEASMNGIHQAIQEQVGGMIDAFYFCPHLPSDSCDCRKPNIGMIKAALADFEIDLENSWVVGDKQIDVELGKQSKVRTALVLTGYGRQHQESLEEPPDAIVSNLGEAAAIISG